MVTNGHKILVTYLENGHNFYATNIIVAGTSFSQYRLGIFVYRALNQLSLPCLSSE